MDKADWIWMPHPGHFIRWYHCQFRLNTYVGGFIVSTLGELQRELMKHPVLDDSNTQTIGGGHNYETMVFKAEKTNYGCCHYEMRSAQHVYVRYYDTAEEAYKGHIEICEKYAERHEIWRRKHGA